MSNDDDMRRFVPRFSQVLKETTPEAIAARRKAALDNPELQAALAEVQQAATASLPPEAESAVVRPAPISPPKPRRVIAKRRENEAPAGPRRRRMGLVILGAVAIVAPVITLAVGATIKPQVRPMEASERTSPSAPTAAVLPSVQPVVSAPVIETSSPVAPGATAARTSAKAGKGRLPVRRPEHHDPVAPSASVAAEGQVPPNVFPNGLKPEF